MWCGISDSIKCGVISDRMGNCWLLRKDFGSRIYGEY
jgi:hypothetical protein